MSGLYLYCNVCLLQSPFYLVKEVKKFVIIKKRFVHLVDIEYKSKPRRDKNKFFFNFF